MLSLREFRTSGVPLFWRTSVTLIKALHFDPNHSENHNLRVNNKKLPYIEKYIDARWQYCDKNEVIDELIEEGFTILDSHQCDNEDDLKRMLGKRLYDDIELWLSNINQKQKDIVQPLRRDMYLVILNHSYMVLGK